MQIIINRSREAQKSINRLRKSIKQKGPVQKIVLFAIVGIVLFVLDNRGMSSENFNGYALAAMLFWGAGIAVYFNTFHPKVTRDARLIMKSYDEADTIANFKLEITDEYFSNEAGNYYTRLRWAAFHAFKLYNKCMLLYAGNSYDTMVIIRQNELSKEEFKEFYAFLKNKMAELK
jgi:hypothetical protein